MVKTITMAELRKMKPPSPEKQHRDNVGRGNFNRWNPLSENYRRPSFSGKRQLELSASPPPDGPSKAPRLDPNLLFEKVKQHEGKLQEAKVLLDGAVKAKAEADKDNDNILDDGTNTCISQMLLVLGALIAHSEGIASSLIDIHGAGLLQPSNTNKNEGNNRNPNPDDQPPRGRSGTVSKKKDLSPEEVMTKKIRQEIGKAEKTITLFDLDLGQVPIINKDTLSGKFTQTIHAAAANSDEVKKGNCSPDEAGEILDDILTCANMEFLGKGGSKKYYNKMKPNDPLNGKFCTVPIKLTFKSKEERVRAEQSLRKFCKVKCSIPYPKKLRTLIGNTVKEGKLKKPDTFIRVKVDSAKMTVTAHASIKNSNGKWVWEDLDISHPIPLDLLEHPDQVTLEQMDQDLENETSSAHNTL
jgi:hypothetical protein